MTKVLLKIAASAAVASMALGQAAYAQDAVENAVPTANVREATQVSEANELEAGTGVIIAILAAAAIVAGIVIADDDDDDEESPS